MSVSVGKAIGYLDLDTSGFHKGFKSALSDIKVFKDESATAVDKLQGAGKAMSAVGSTTTKAFTIPLVGAGAAAVTTAAKFESAMSEVGAISGATGKDLEALTSKAKEMGATTKFSASESAEALKYMAMAGWDTQKMLDGLPGIMNLAAASGEDLGTVSDIVTDAMTAFGLSADQAAHFSDVLAQASNRSNTSVGLMGETFKYIAPVAGALGYTIEDMSVAIGLMANSGIKGSQAGTQLRSVLSRMAKPTDEVEAAMKKLGLSLTDSEGNMLSFNDIMLDMREGFAGLTKEQQAQYAAILAGQEGMSGLLAIVNTSEADFNALSEAINNSSGAAGDMANTMQDNLMGQLTILKSTLEGIAISFGDILLPMVKAAIQKLQDFASWVNGLTEEQKELIVVVFGIVAALGPALLIFGKFATAISSIINLIGGAGGLKAILTALHGPLGLIIGAVIALTTAWITNFGGIRDYTAEVFNIISSLVSDFLNFLLGLWNDNFLGIQDITRLFGESVELIFQTLFENISNIFQIFSAIFHGDWETAWNLVKETAHNTWETIKTVFANFLNIIVDTLIRIGVNLYHAAKEAFHKVLDGFKYIWGLVMSWLEEAIQDPVGTILGIGEKLFEAGASIFSSLWEGMQSIWHSITSWVSDSIDWLVSKVKFWESESSKISTPSPSKSAPPPGSHSAGLDYVPYNGYRAELHEGEAVLTKQQNKERNKSNGGDTFIFQSPKPIDPIIAARELKKVKQELAEDIL